jgi:hypothetical protein
MTDLWKANAFERLIIQVMWQDQDDNTDEAEADEAFHTYCKAPFARGDSKITTTTSKARLLLQGPWLVQP